MGQLEEPLEGDAARVGAQRFRGVEGRPRRCRPAAPHLQLIHPKAPTGLALAYGVSRVPHLVGDPRQHWRQRWLDQRRQRGLPQLFVIGFGQALQRS